MLEVFQAEACNLTFKALLFAEGKRRLLRPGSFSASARAQPMNITSPPLYRAELQNRQRLVHCQGQLGARRPHKTENKKHKLWGPHFLLMEKARCSHVANIPLIFLSRSKVSIYTSSIAHRQAQKSWKVRAIEMALVSSMYVADGSQDASTSVVCTKLRETIQRHSQQGGPGLSHPQTKHLQRSACSPCNSCRGLLLPLFQSHLERVCWATRLSCEGKKRKHEIHPAAWCTVMQPHGALWPSAAACPISRSPRCCSHRGDVGA